MDQYQVKTRLGILQGVPEEDSVVFRKVPYAKPPVGQRRFKAPEKLEEWEGVYHCDEFPPMGIQESSVEMDLYGKEFYQNPDFQRPMSEDCLYLTIWVPKEAQRESHLPVAFWIHGGAFNHGFGTEQEFDGKAYNRRGIVFVSVQYRLGALGFLAHPWLSEENENHVSGNYGTLDQIAALTWVHENIEAFGGDPDNITVMGQSAGACSSQILSSTPLTGSLIRHTILQSGAALHNNLIPTPLLKEAEEAGMEFTKRSGITSLKELRAIDAESLLTLQTAYEQYLASQGRGLVFTPNADGYVLKEPVGTLWQHHQMKKIPYMIGCVSGDIFENENGKKGGLLMQEAEGMAREGASCGAKVYLYYFSHELPGGGRTAFHSAELWYMMGTYTRCWRPMGEADDKLSRLMLDEWSSFIKYGRPLSGWEPWTESSDNLREFQ